MRRYLLVLPLVIACAKAETPPADSVAAAPAALTEADVAGTWTGTFKAEGSDSTIQWTNVCAAGTCRLVAANAPNDTTVATYVIQADSVMGTTAAYMDPMVKAMVVDHWVARPTAGQLTGSGHLTLADKPDSVVMRYTFTGSRNP